MATFTTFLSKPPTTLSHTANYKIKATHLQSQHNFSTFTRSKNPNQQHFFTKTQPVITITNATVSPKERQLSNTDERVKQIHSIEDFDEALRSAKDKLVVVEYAASTSYHSRKIYPVMVDLSRTCNDVEFLLVMGDENDKTKELCKREKIEKVPHFSFYKSMQIIHEEEGIGPDELVGDVLYYGDIHSEVEQLHSRDDVEKLIEGHKADHKLIVLDVGLKHCGPCVKVYPTVLKLSKQMGGTVVFARMNGDENESCMEFLKDMEVIEVPTFLFIRDGEICGRYVGSGKGELIGEILSISTFDAFDVKRCTSHALALGILSLPVSSDHDSSTISTNLRFGRKIINNNNNIVDSDVSESKEDQWTEILSWEPRAFLYHNFLSKKECEYLIDLAKPHMAKSTVVDTKTGKSNDSRVRTSSGMFLQRGRDKIISNIEKRIADFTLIPADHGEGLHVLHYEVGQKYEPHYDCFLDELNTKNGGQRIATVIMYLSDVEEGGETVFPAAKGNFSSLPGWNEWSDCAKRGLFVKPKMGDALVFWSIRPDGSLDPSSLHGSCPVIRGNKWSSTKWLHVDEYKL